MDNSNAKHLSTIDIIKGIAIWMIILVHSRQKIPNLSPWLQYFDIGQMGCQMFFVISGFSSMLSYERITQQPKPARTFYKKRLITIIPGWYAIIFIVYLLNTLSLAMSGETIGFASNRNPVAILCNLLLLQGLLPFCNNDVAGGGWYLGTLVIFYLLVPLIYRFMHKQKIFLVKCIPWVMEAVSCVLVIGTYFISRRKYGYAVLQNNRFVYFSFVNQMGCFLLGVSLYFEQKSNSIGKNSFMHAVLCIFYAVLLPVVFFSGWKITFVIVPYIMGLATYYLMKCMLSAECRNAAIYEKKKIFHLLKAFGKHSYYIYLVHVLFVWGMPLTLQRILVPLRRGEQINGNLFYIILIVPIFVLSYYTAVLFQKILGKMLKKMTNNIDKFPEKG